MMTMMQTILAAAILVTLTWVQLSFLLNSTPPPTSSEIPCVENMPIVFEGKDAILAKEFCTILKLMHNVQQVDLKHITKVVLVQKPTKIQRDNNGATYTLFIAHNSKVSFERQFYAQYAEACFLFLSPPHFNLNLLATEWQVCIKPSNFKKLLAEKLLNYLVFFFSAATEVEAAAEFNNTFANDINIRCSFDVFANRSIFFIAFFNRDSFPL